MELKKTNCTECGSPIAISDDVDYINCAACGTFFAVQRGEGYIGLKAVKEITKAIQDSGQGTQDVIRESTQVTRAELQRLQLTQEIAMAEMKLGNLQAEIRGLEREEKSLKIEKQTRNLHGIEYNTLAELRLKRLQAAALGPRDLNSRLKTAENRLDWLNSEVNALSQSDLPFSKKKQASMDLENQIVQAKSEIFILRTQLIKSELQSYQTAAVPLDNQAALLSLISQLNKDEAKLRQMPSTAETQAISKDISERKKKASEAWTKLEHQRISSGLRSTGSIANQNDLNSLKQQLYLVNEDLNTIRQMPQNNVVKDYEKGLSQQQQSLTKQVSKLERDLQKAQEQARKNALKSTQAAQGQSTGSGVKTGILAGIGLALAAFFAGIAALGKEIGSSISSSKGSQTANAQDARPAATTIVSAASVATLQASDQTVRSSHTPASTVSESTTARAAIGGVEMQLAANPLIAPEGLSGKISPTQANELLPVSPASNNTGLRIGSLAKGCSLWVLIAIGFTVVGMVVMGLTPNTEGTYYGMWFFFLAAALGFGAGAWIFLRNVAPLTQIKGIGPVKDFMIRKTPKDTGISNALAVKGLTGLISCIFVYLLFLSISAMLPQDSVLWAFCIGILVGPIVGGVVAKRTDLREMAVE
jgi:hypothetical protein